MTTTFTVFASRLLALSGVVFLASCYHPPEYSYDQPVDDVDHLVEGYFKRKSARKQRLRGARLSENSYGGQSEAAEEGQSGVEGGAEPTVTKRMEKPKMATGSPLGSHWSTDFQSAWAKAKSTGKPMLLNFSGLDWCEHCQKLEGEIFGTPQFKSYAQSDLVLVNLDFPRQNTLDPEVAKQNEELRNHYNVQGFPSIVLLSSDGTYLGQTGYQAGGPAPFIEAVKRATARR